MLLSIDWKELLNILKNQIASIKYIYAASFLPLLLFRYPKILSVQIGFEDISTHRGRIPALKRKIYTKPYSLSKE